MGSKTAIGVISILLMLLTFLVGRYSVGGQIATINSRLDKLETLVTLQVPAIASDISEIKASQAALATRLDGLVISVAKVTP